MTETVSYKVQFECWNPENWLTYRGDHRESIGRLLGPGWHGEMATVVAARYEPDHVWPDGRTGRTLLGCVTGDVRPEMGPVIKSTLADGVVQVLVGIRS